MLELNNITVKFDGLVAVDNVSFCVKAGTIFGLIGPNGAGKTTLFNTISGINIPTNGEIKFLEKNIEGKKPYVINECGIGRTYQNINIFKNMSCIENVIAGRHSKTKTNLVDAIIHTNRCKKELKESRDKSREILAFVGLEGKEDIVASSLSYGDQRKLEIARALASEPKMLLLDEPAAGMNLKEKNDLASLIKQINAKGITILIVEHNMKLVMNICKDICVLNHGKKIAYGNPETIKNNKDVISAYLGDNKHE